MYSVFLRRVLAWYSQKTVPVPTRHTPSHINFEHARRLITRTQFTHEGHLAPANAPAPPHAHTPSESSARYHSQGRHGTHLTWSIRTAHTSHMVDSQTSSRCSIRQRAKQSFRRFRRFRRAYGAPEGRARSPPIGRRAAPRASLRAWHGPWPRARRPWLRPPRPRARSW